MKMICIGDSVTFGYGVHSAQRWTNRIARETGWDVVNEGINGDTTGGMLARMQTRVLPELRACGLCAERPYIMVMGGSNDIFYAGTDTVARANMGAMIHQIFALCAYPVVGIPLPVDGKRAPEAWAAVVDFSAAEQQLRAYRTWLKQYCAAFGVPYIDFCMDFLWPDGSPRTELLLDGLHPTAEGHDLMARRLIEQFNKP